MDLRTVKAILKPRPQDDIYRYQPVDVLDTYSTLLCTLIHPCTGIYCYYYYIIARLYLISLIYMACLNDIFYHYA